MRPLAAAGPDTRPTLKKPARELRQGGSDYRCCIPALAGFVSPQSIAPDGEQTFSQESQRATRNRGIGILPMGTLAGSQCHALHQWRCDVSLRRAQHAVPTIQPNGRFAFMRATSVLCTRAALPRRRLRFALFAVNK